MNSKWKGHPIAFSGELGEEFYPHFANIIGDRLWERGLALELHSNSFAFTGELELEDLQPLRQLLKKWLEYLNASDRDLNNLELLFEELVSNILRHSYNREDRKFLEFHLKKEADKYVISTKDYGLNGRDKVLVEKLCTEYRLNKKSKKRGGIGLFIIKKLAVEIKYTPGEGDSHNHLTVTIKSYE